MSKNNLQKLELTWIGKGKEPKLEPRILIENPEYSYGDTNTENILIHGDNLLALKALEQDFAGKIKCIYIDPPYNTGNAFEHYDDGVEHSLWLNLMYQRILILYKLLSKDGVIFINIDDKEMDYLKITLDEIFGRNNFLNRLTVKTSDPSGHKTVNPSPYSQTEFILMYSKDRTFYKYDIQYIESNYDPMYGRIIPNYEEHYSKWKSFSLNEYYAVELGYENAKDARKNIGKLDFEHMVSKYALENANKVYQPTAISNVAGRETVELRDESKKNEGIVYYQKRENYDDIYILNGRQIYFYSSKIKEVEGIKMPAKPLTNLWTDVPYNGIASEGNVSFKNGKKPEKLIRRCIEICTVPGDYVLDSFLGSGTTAAVAHKMNRKYIGIELGEHAKTHCYPRLKAVVDGEQGGISKAVNWQGGGGFKFYTLAPSLLKQDKFGNWVISQEYNPDMLAAAMAKQEGFTYLPHEDKFWKQGNSSESDFIFTTTQFLTVETLDSIHDDMQEGEKILICCKAFQKECKNKYPNISLKKIPQMLLDRCEFGKDDYSLNIVNMPKDDTELDEEEIIEEITIQELSDKKNTDEQQTLF